jgi:exonuclease VII small subunit
MDMDQIAQALTQPWTMYFFVGTILLVALRPLSQAIFSLKAVNADLETATQVLMKIDPAIKQQEFYSYFKTISAEIAKINGLRHAWREFVYSLYFENANVARKVYLSHRPSYYFNRDSVLGTRLNLAQFLAYPNYLIGLGLTFTFIGLTAALHVAQAGLVSGAGQEALKNLLAVASIKFISSITGLVSSLAVSIIQRLRLRKFQQKLAQFCDLLEECTEYKSTEKLLHDNIHEQRKHSELLASMAPDIARSIGDALGTHMAASVSASLAPVTQDLKALAEKFTGACEDALHKVLEEFLRQLRQRSAEDMLGLMNSISSLRQSLEQLAENMRATGKNFSTDMKEPALHLTSVVEQFTTAFTPLPQALKQWETGLTVLETTAGKIEQAGIRINTAAEENQRSTSELEKTASGITTRVASIGDMMTALSQSFTDVGQAASDLKTAGGIIATAADNLSKTDGNWQPALSELAQGSKQFSSGVEAFSQLIEEKFLAAIGNLDRAISELNGEKPSYFARIRSMWGK